MGFIRPATPGFLATLVATILLAIVSFCVPYFRSVYFLKANISISNVNGSITFGTLGYCIDLPSNGTTCSDPSVGYQLDINELVGNELPVEIPQVAVKWLTYALVLHIVALALAAGSAVFGLLAHVREMSMACFSTCVSGFAAAVALLAFIFDIALFFIARARINDVGSAEIGNAIWLTLAAWILLFFSGCFYTLGRCCISKRKPRGDWRKDHESGNNNGYDHYAEQVRLDAVKAEADRKARQAKPEVGLPAFYETQPLTARVDGDSVMVDKYHDNHTTPASPTHTGAYGGRPAHGGGYSGGGYVQAPSGTRAVDEYYNPSQPANNVTSYPPQPQRQASYASSYAHVAPSNPTPPPALPSAQYLATPERYGSPHQYGHSSSGTSYHSAASHQQYPTAYSQYDSYYDQQPQRQPSYADPYSIPASPIQAQPYASHTTSYYTPPATTPQPERSYTLGGDGYGANQVPPLPGGPSQVGGASLLPFPGESQKAPSPPPKVDTNIPPRAMSPEQHQYEDSPPKYEAGTSNIQGAWGKS